MIGLGEVERVGEGLLACREPGRRRDNLAEDCVDAGGVGGLLGGSLGEGEGLGQTALAEEGVRG